MSEVTGERGKITPAHLARLAFVYVRQSSPQQVRRNLESQRRQYDFAARATALGWSRDRVVVLDGDQGKSGAIPYARTAFGELASAVARAEAGIVMSLELSRLARNDADWHHLVYLCRWSETLIADEQGIYDPTASADRMMLGIRGQVNELERDNAVHRMVEARWTKARRGEAFTIPPAGYERDERGTLVLAPDQAVHAALVRVFQKFDELGTVRQVYLWWRDEGLPFPVRRLVPRVHPVVWRPVSYRLLVQTLHHPIYAGAYVFGRSETRRELDPETQRLVVRRVPRKEWPVLIQDHHPAYISFAQYLQNQTRMRENEARGRRTDESHQGAVREGRALLQGLVRCGQCGRQMYVNYGGAAAARTLQYRCARVQVLHGSPECQLVGGKRIEATVVEAFLQATEVAGPAAAALAGEQQREEITTAERAWQLEIEKAEYEAGRAERQYNAVEPEHRTVARELERRWNERLTELQAVRARAAAARAQHHLLTTEELARAQHLGTHLEEVWHAATTTMRERKRLLRCLIDEVQLRTEATRHRVRVVWKGGAITDREVVRFAPGAGAARRTPEDTIALVRQLAAEFDDAQIARILNRQGRRSGLGRAFTQASVLSLRGKYQIPKCPRPAPARADEGPFTAQETARVLGVTMSTVHRWLRNGILAGQQATPGAPWRIVLTADVRQRVSTGTAPASWVGVTEAARRLGRSTSYVTYLVTHGQLPAIRTTVGKRTCWRIDVSSAAYDGQPALFEQMTNGPTKES
jgi:DNA invertase Pin-like site-specific DNA recombinase